jgi:hypothetical protein
MSENSNILKQVRPGLLALVDGLVAKGAERNAVIYMIEKEAMQLRDGQHTDRVPAANPVVVEEPANDWPGAVR